MSQARWLQRAWCWLHIAELTLIVVLLIAMVLVATMQIILRNFFDMGLLWADPSLRYMLLWLGLLGALAASREDKHISIDLLSKLIPARYYHWVKAVTALFTICVCLIVAYHSLRFVIDEYQYEAIAFAGIPAWCIESVIPLTFFLIAVRYCLVCGHYCLHRSYRPSH